MFFSACHKEEIDSIPKGAIKLTTEGFSNGDGSKTSVNGYTVEWVNGDKVTINNEEYTVFVDGSTAYITPGEGSEPTAPSAPYYGYYSCGTVNGYYWSSSPNGVDKAYCVFFNLTHVPMESNNYRNYGYSVRLVYDAN